MATTTFAAFRDAQATRIAALTPSAFSDVPFREHLDEVDIRAWALEYPQASMRRFAIEDTFSPSLPQITNGDVWWWEGTEQIVIAYPTDGRYGQANLRDLSDVLRQDFYQIDAAIGARAGAYSSGHAVIASMSQEQHDAVTFLVLTYTFRFWRGQT